MTTKTGELTIGILPAREAMARVDGINAAAIRITPPALAGARAKVALSLVIDASGSMSEAASRGGEGSRGSSKMRFVKEAAHFLVDQLADGDVVSVVSFDDVPSVCVQPQLAGAMPRAGVHAAIERIQPGGGTNIQAAFLAASAQFAGPPQRQFSSRVILLSDGNANQGITAGGDLAAMTRAATANGLTVSTVGVGLDYNSALLAAMADSGGGAFHYVEDARSAEAALVAELFEAGEIAARRVMLEVTVPAVASIQPNLNGYPQETIPGGIRVELGDVARQRDLVVMFSSVDAGGGDTLAIRARVAAVAPDGTAIEAETEGSIRLVAPDELAAAGEDPEVVDLINRLKAAEAEASAAAHLEVGDVAGARAAWSQAEDDLQSLGFPGGGSARYLRAMRLIVEDTDPQLAAKRLHDKAHAARRGRRGVPFPRAYWVDERLLAGCFPGDPDAGEARRKLERLRTSNVSVILNLQVPGEVGHGGTPFRPYEAEANVLGMRVLSRPIPDGNTVDEATMVEILDTIDAEIGGGATVYVHCWGGRGRTGTVVGCWLARHGRGGPKGAVRRVGELRAACPDASQPSPETVAQVQMVEAWPQGR